MTSGNREDYLISILRLTSDEEKNVKTTELASFMGVSPASVTEMIKTLSGEGLVVYERYKGLRLSDKGMSMARQVRKKHHVLERFLTEYLEMDHMDAHDEAHRMEHSISDSASIRICNMIGNPIDDDCIGCPQPCKSYTKGEKDIVQLNTIPKNKTGRISYLSSENPDIVKNLTAIGFVPGRYVKIESILMDGRDRVIRIGDNSIVLSFPMASAVFVDLKG